MKIKQTITFHFTHNIAPPPCTIEREHSWGDNPQVPDHVAESLILVCPHCCKVWAVLEIEGNPLFDSRMVPCYHHPPVEPFGLVPGSILTEEGIGRIDTALLDALPRELVIREFYLHLKAFSQETISHVNTYNPSNAINSDNSTAEFNRLCFAGG